MRKNSTLGRYDKRAAMRCKPTAERDEAALRFSSRDAKRFWARVLKTEECWLWNVVHPSGYGHFYLQGVVMRAHRVALLWAQGLPGGPLDACHRCNNKRCVNPGHLYWGTRRENLLDDHRVNPARAEHWRGERHWKAQLNEERVLAIWHAYHVLHAKQADIAAEYGVTESAVCHLCAGRSWANLTKGLPKKRV